MEEEFHAPAEDGHEENDDIEARHLEGHDFRQVFAGVCHTDNGVEAAGGGSEYGAYDVEVGHMAHDEGGAKACAEEYAGTEDHDGDLIFHTDEHIEGEHGAHAYTDSELSGVIDDGGHLHIDDAEQFHGHGTDNGAEHAAAGDMEVFEKATDERSADNKDKQLVIHNPPRKRYLPGITWKRSLGKRLPGGDTGRFFSERQGGSGKTGTRGKQGIFFFFSAEERGKKEGPERKEGKYFLFKPRAAHSALYENGFFSYI